MISVTKQAMVEALFEEKKVGGSKTVVGSPPAVLISRGSILGVIKLLDAEHEKGKVVDMN